MDNYSFTDRGKVRQPNNNKRLQSGPCHSEITKSGVNWNATIMLLRTAWSKSVDVVEQLRLCNSRVAHQTDVYAAYTHTHTHTRACAGSQSDCREWVNIDQNWVSIDCVKTLHAHSVVKKCKDRLVSEMTKVTAPTLQEFEEIRTDEEMGVEAFPESDGADVTFCRGQSVPQSMCKLSSDRKSSITDGQKRLCSLQQLYVQFAIRIFSTGRVQSNMNSSHT